MKEFECTSIAKSCVRLITCSKEKFEALGKYNLKCRYEIEGQCAGISSCKT